MRKYLIIVGAAIWVVLVLTGIFLVVNRTSQGSNDDIAVLMQSEPATTAASETEAITSEPEFLAGITTLPEETTVPAEPEIPVYIPEEPKILPAPEPEIPPESNNSSTKAEEDNKTGEADTPPKETEAALKQMEGKENTESSFAACGIAADGLDVLRYWLYTPSNPTENMPLIVYLHGGSGKGDDLNLLTSVDGFPQYLQSGMLGDVRAYVVMPQLPSSQKGWVDIGDSLYSLIAYITSEYGIDADNVSLTGHSMGGTGTWSFAAAYPELFARIAPLSGSVRNASDTAAKLTDIPVWAFVGSADTIVPPESSVEMVSLLLESGADARITILDGADHFAVPSLVYLDEDTDLLGWLMDQEN